MQFESGAKMSFGGFRGAGRNPSGCGVIPFQHFGQSPNGEINNNPDKFRLWATNSSYVYTFTYDPLAADEWRFETGGFIVTNHP
jgi:hypothetical protein